MTENFIIERIVKGLTNEGTMFGTTPWEQIDSREAMNLAVGYIESREWETIETDEELSSAPTGLTAVQEFVEGVRGISENVGTPRWTAVALKGFLAILESSSAPTPEMEG
jgi:hypothetical protein